jgi:hypothetical protein
MQAILISYLINLLDKYSLIYIYLLDKLRSLNRPINKPSLEQAMTVFIDSPQLAHAEGEQKTGCANAGNSLPVVVNANAAKFGFKIKLVPVLIDGVQTAWEQVHISSQLTEVRSSSTQALRDIGARVPFVDYDPIMQDATRRTGERLKPVWCGD